MLGLRFGKKIRVTELLANVFVHRLWPSPNVIEHKTLSQDMKRETIGGSLAFVLWRDYNRERYCRDEANWKILAVLANLQAPLVVECEARV